jgi:O-methyltransferase involved in polyketide biosynthesis
MIRIIKTSGGRILKEQNAAGAEGILIRSFVEGKVTYYFRVYNNDKTFDDYLLQHNDLAVTISTGYEASFYENEQGEKVLDHSPETLGWEVIDSKE